MIAARVGADHCMTPFVGVGFTNVTHAEIAIELDRLSRSAGFSFVVTPNVDHVVMLHRQRAGEVTERFRRAYEAADMCICDSRVLQTLAWLRGVSLTAFPGSDLTAFLFENGCLDDRKVAIVGGDEAMLAELRMRFPAITIAQHIPPMGVLDKPHAIDDIKEFLTRNRFDYILFAIGAPQSEIIAHHCSVQEGTSGVAICIGASIEFLLGRKARAPKWMQYARLEWAFRLLSEPRRLWRRYLLSGPRILLIVQQWRRS